MKRRIVRALLGVVIVVALVWFLKGGGADFLFWEKVTVGCINTSTYDTIISRPSARENACLAVSPILAGLLAVLLASVSVALLAPVFRKRE